MGQIKIGREFFAKVKLDYADWHWALVREFLQNCIDAPGCDTVEVSIARDGGNTSLMVSNNGEPMDEDVLNSKLLTLGGSGKNFEGDNTGGFGVAKSLLYYCHLSYRIVTGSLLVEGEGAQFTVTQASPIDGTKSTVLVEGDVVSNLEEECRRFAQFSQWRGTLRLNGKVLATDLKKGTRRREFRWGTVYTNNSFANVCIVRINGQPMFTRYARTKGCVLVELSGKAKDVLTSNRDGMKHEYANELSDFLTALAVDKRSALREQKAAYKRYEGERIKNEAKKPKAAGVSLDDLIDVAALAEAIAGNSGPAGERTAPATSDGGVRTMAVERQDVKLAPSSRLGTEFIVKNTTGMATPDYYTPGSGFSNYSKGLVRAWAAVILKLYQIHDMAGEFSIGFVFDEESVAEHEVSTAYGRVYYLNPARVVFQRDKPQCRSFKARYTGAWANRFDIIASANHEFVHGLGFNNHDEDFASKLSEVQAVVMAHMSELTTLFRA